MFTIGGPSQPVATAAPTTLEDVRELLREVRTENTSAGDQLYAAEIGKLGQDGAHLRTIVYWLVGCIVALLLAAWQFYMFLDGKIERNANYVNQRIDALFVTERSEDDAVYAPQPIPPTLNAPQETPQQ
jgi:hypothetical protein